MINLEPKAQSLALVVTGGLREALKTPAFWPSPRDVNVSLITHLKRLIPALIFEYLF